MKGEAVTKTFRAVIEFGAEVESLFADLESTVTKAIGEMRDFKIVLGKQLSNTRCDDNEWMYTDYAISIPVARRSKGKQNPFGYISYQVSFVGDGIGKLNEPLLHVSLWANRHDFENGEYMGFPISDEASLNLADGRLLTWESGTKKYPFFWTYSIKLMSIINMDAVKRLAVKPVIELLRLYEFQDRTKWESLALEKALPLALLDVGVLKYENDLLGLPSQMQNYP